MGERKGVNKYYPPDYDPSKGGLNKFQGTHALRERARKIHLGIIIIRFEMPYNIWCDGCSNHIGMGVRYNAEKTKVGMYYSTPIYQFRMKCHLCDNHFEIKTDPANLDYVIVSGARRQENRWDPGDNEQIVTEDKNVIRKIAADSMFKLEHGVQDKDKSEELKNTLESLEDLQESRWKDDFAANSALRQRMRKIRKEAEEQKEKDRKLNLNIALLPPSAEDGKIATLLQFSQTKSSVKTSEQRRNEINSESIFSKSNRTLTKSLDKKGTAKRVIGNIVTSNQKNFDTFTRDLPNLKLGIRPKDKVDTVPSTQQKPKPSCSEEIHDTVFSDENNDSSVSESNTLPSSTEGSSKDVNIYNNGTSQSLSLNNEGETSNHNPCDLESKNSSNLTLHRNTQSNKLIVAYDSSSSDSDTPKG